MKQLYTLIILLFLSVLAKAQNWQTVYSDRVQYYDSGVQAIKIVSTRLDINGDSIFRNYPQDYDYGKYVNGGLKVVDTLAWMGRKLIIRNNGFNGFINYNGDTCWINTQAAVGEKWYFVKNDTINIEAVVDTQYYGSINGFTDSIKIIRFKVNKWSKNYNNFDTAINQKKLYLSKHAGLLNSFQYASCCANYNGGSQRIGGRVYWQTKINLFTKQNFYRYTPGDVIHVKWENNDQSRLETRLKFYRYIDKYTSMDTVFYVVERKNIYIEKVLYDPFTHKTFQTESGFYNDTEYYTNLGGQVLGAMPNSIGNLEGGTDVSISSTTHTIKYCANSEPMPVVFFRFEGVYKSADSTLETPFEYGSFGSFSAGSKPLSTFEDGSRSGGGIGIPYTEQETIQYQKNSCGETGTNIILSTNDNTAFKSLVSVYPNPANDVLTIDGDNILLVNLINMSGKQYPVYEAKQTSSITVDVSAYAIGLYILQIVSDSGVTAHKLIISR